MISVILLTANVRNRETKKGVLQISYYAERMLCNVFTKDYTCSKRSRLCASQTL